MSKPPPHPAKFSDGMIPLFAELLRKHVVQRDMDIITILDPFAGTGRIHELMELDKRFMTFGIEIEHEWAEMHVRTVRGDATTLPWIDETFDAITTSCTYANRLADSHNAQERCKACGGSGYVDIHDTCPKCKGAGHRQYKRLTYTHQLGRKLDPRNTGGMQWGPAYREMHLLAWTEARRVLVPGGVLILNISDHIRNHEVIGVTNWHVGCLLGLGFTLLERREFPTKRMRFGANRESRTDCEHILVFRKGDNPT